MKSKGLYRALTAILAVGVLPVAFTGCGQEKVKESTTTSTVISVVDDDENAGEADAKDESKDESGVKNYCMKTFNLIILLLLLF